MRSPAATAGKRGRGRKADAKGDAKNRELFHAETPSNQHRNATRNFHCPDYGILHGIGTDWPAL
jgi:hypothetical protein